LAFRDAHEAVARAVRTAAEAGVDLSELPLDALRDFSPLIDADVYAVLTPEGSVASRDHVGGTAPAQVEARWPRPGPGSPEAEPDTLRQGSPAAARLPRIQRRA
ncbi:MAG: hypothetical protein ACOYLX_20485, partial [Burkholderiaceae bacterium]